MGEDKKEKGLEDKVMGKKIISVSIKDMKWVVTSVIAVVLWISTVVLWVQDKNAQKERIDKQETKIGTLKTENETLKGKVATLEGQVQGVSQASEIFMKNSPSENRYRVELLEKRVDRLEIPGSNPTLMIELDTNRVIRRDR